MRLIASALLVGVVPLLALAADKPKDLIVGKWEVVSEGTSKGVIVEYKADGTTTASKGEKVLPTGKYKFVEDDLMEFESKLAGNVIKYRVKISKDEMTTTDEKTKAERKFKRVK
jgi:uncharacterized protein (TIGR03066 family)